MIPHSASQCLGSWTSIMFSHALFFALLPCFFRTHLKLHYAFCSQQLRNAREQTKEREARVKGFCQVCHTVVWCCNTINTAAKPPDHAAIPCAHVCVVCTCVLRACVALCVWHVAVAAAAAAVVMKAVVPGCLPCLPTPCLPPTHRMEKKMKNEERIHTHTPRFHRIWRNFWMTDIHAL